MMKSLFNRRKRAEAAFEAVKKKAIADLIAAIRSENVWEVRSATEIAIKCHAFAAFAPDSETFEAALSASNGNEPYFETALTCAAELTVVLRAVSEIAQRAPQESAFSIFATTLPCFWSPGRREALRDVLDTIGPEFYRAAARSKTPAAVKFLHVAVKSSANVLEEMESFWESPLDKVDAASGDTMLLAAARSGNSKGVAALLSADTRRSFDFSTVDRDGKGLAHLAAESGDPKTLAIVLDSFANILKQRTFEGDTPLMSICGLDRKPSPGHEWAVAKMISMGADVNAVDIHGQTPLLCAVINDQANVAAMLIKHGARVFLSDSSLEEDSRTDALKVACSYCSLETADCLLNGDEWPPLDGSDLDWRALFKEIVARTRVFFRQR